MKLKKIASLMLAGIMAVSMLAGCKSGDTNNGGAGSSSSEQTNTSGYTASVMANADATAKAMFKAGSSSQVESAVKYAAANNSVTTPVKSLTPINSANAFADLAQVYMGNAEYAYEQFDDTNYDNTFKTLWGTKDTTVYTLFHIQRAYNNDLIDREVVKTVNMIATVLDANTKNLTGDYDYTINIAKADSWQNKKEANADNDSVIVGIAITLDYTADSFNA